jgi:hypothetical protein
MLCRLGLNTAEVEAAEEPEEDRAYGEHEAAVEPEEDRAYGEHEAEAEAVMTAAVEPEEDRAYREQEAEAEAVRAVDVEAAAAAKPCQVQMYRSLQRHQTVRGN